MRRKRSSTDSGSAAKKKKGRLAALLDLDSDDSDPADSQTQTQTLKRSESAQDAGDSPPSLPAQDTAEEYCDPFGGVPKARLKKAKATLGDSQSSDSQASAQGMQESAAHRLDMTFTALTASSSEEDSHHRLECLVEILAELEGAPSIGPLVTRFRADFQLLLEGVVVAPRLSPYGSEVQKFIFQTALNIVVCLCSGDYVRLLQEPLSAAVFTMLETAVMHDESAPQPRSSSGSGDDPLRRRSSSSLLRTLSSGSDATHVAKKLKTQMMRLFTAVMTGPAVDGPSCQLVQAYGAPTFAAGQSAEAQKKRPAETVPSLLLHCVASLIVFTDADVLRSTVSFSNASAGVGSARKSFKQKARGAGAVQQHAAELASITSRSEFIAFLTDSGRLEPLLLVLRECAEQGAPRVLLRSVYISQLLTCYVAAIPESREALVSTACCIFPAVEAATSGDTLSPTHSTWLQDRMGWTLLHATQGLPRPQLHAFKRLLCTADMFAAVRRSILADTSQLAASRDASAEESDAADSAHDRICVYLNVLTTLIESHTQLVLPDSQDGTQDGEGAEEEDEEGEAGGADDACQGAPAADPKELYGLPDLAQLFYRLCESPRVDDRILCSYTALCLVTVSVSGKVNRVAVRSCLIDAKGGGLRGACPDRQSNNPMADICAALQQFILFQSRHGLLTVEVAAWLVRIDQAMIRMSGLSTSGGVPDPPSPLKCP